MNCLFPLCKRNAESNGYCVLHGRHYANSVEVKLKKEIPKESDKEKERKKELKKLYPEFLKKHPMCQVKMKGCASKAVCIHHIRGRIGDQVFEQKDWLASCAFCNTELEREDALAREKKVKKSKFNNND